MEDELVENFRELRPDGSVYFRRRYASGFAAEGVFAAEPETWPERRWPVDMCGVRSACINRMALDAASNNDGDYLESRWEEVWGNHE